MMNAEQILVFFNMTTGVLNKELNLHTFIYLKRLCVTALPQKQLVCSACYILFIILTTEVFFFFFILLRHALLQGV